jgi:type-F conjugative transfer system pilin assembly protein TrbC
MGRSRLELCNMEETKLLRILILIITQFITLPFCAHASEESWVKDIARNNHIDESERKWAEDIANRDQQMTMNNFKEMMNEQGFEPDMRDSVLKPRPVLQIFVSTSMPKQLLKAYAREASRYNGVLVFRGLPNGSFRKLTNLVMDISDENHPAAMQIDDEAFRGFDIKVVPTIVLSKPVSMFDEQTKIGKFDKVRGNITIKGALELFSNNGDLAVLARGMLK